MPDTFAPLINPPGTTKKMAWLDLETTGLDPEKDEILEIGIVITDQDLNPGLEWSKVIIPSRVPLDHMNAFVRDMHTKNGLLLATDSSDALSVEYAEEDAIRNMEVLFGFTGHQEKVPLCGSTIGFDRSFLRVHMPKLNEFFHYRSIDVSSIRELAKYWYPELPEPPKSEAHRSIQDIHQSIKLLKFYREKVFKRKGEIPQWIAEKAIQENYALNILVDDLKKKIETRSNL